MTLFFIFAGLASIGIVSIIAQNVAIRFSVPKDSVLSESEMLASPKKMAAGRGNAPPVPPATGFPPPVSILKPLKGLDDDLFDNLASICNQDYPEYEIIFALEEEDDPALKVAQKIKKMYPRQKISIVVKQKDYALNPKVNNLMAAYEATQFPYFLISDSDVRVDTNYLKEITKPLKDPQVGLVNNLIRGIGSCTLGSLLENLHLNSFVIGYVALLTTFFKMPIVMGKSMLIKKKDFEEIGGFAAVKNVLAEDYIVGLLMHNKGKKVVTSGYVINAVNKHRTMKQFFKRHARWGKLRRNITGFKYISELISNTVFIACLSLIVVGPTTRTIALAAAASLVTIIGDYGLGRRIRSAHRFVHYLLTPIKDIIIGIMWFVPFFDRTVMWRRHRYKITRGSYLVPLPDKKVQQ